MIMLDDAKYLYTDNNISLHINMYLYIYHWIYLFFILANRRSDSLIKNRFSPHFFFSTISNTAARLFWQIQGKVHIDILFFLCRYFEYFDFEIFSQLIQNCWRLHDMHWCINPNTFISASFPFIELKTNPSLFLVLNFSLMMMISMMTRISPTIANDLIEYWS